MNVYVVIEMLKGNVPRVIGVFKDEKKAKEVAKSCDGVGYVDKQILI